MQNTSLREGYAVWNNQHNIHIVFWCLPGRELTTLGHESAAITTRPWLLALINLTFYSYSLVMLKQLEYKLNQSSINYFQITENMMESKQNLRELTILKFKKLTQMEIFELEALRERMSETVFVSPAGYFKLNRNSLIVSRVLLVAYVLLLMACR